jgi:hypothetical protein
MAHRLKAGSHHAPTIHNRSNCHSADRSSLRGYRRADWMNSTPPVFNAACKSLSTCGSAALGTWNSDALA